MAQLYAPVPIPLKLGPTSHYGADRGDVTHFGVDLQAKPGTRVIAPEDLVVEAVAVNDTSPPLSGYGPAAILGRGLVSGLWHVLGHMDAWDWSGLRVARLPFVGREYGAGEEIGVVSKLNHVHWELRTEPRPPRGEARRNFTLDPIAWLESDGIIRKGLPDPAPRSSGGGGLVWLGLGALLLWANRRR